MIDELNKMRRILRGLLGLFLYRPWFGGYGRRIVIEHPTLISGARHIHLGNSVKIRRGVRLEAIRTPGYVPSIEIGEGTNIEQNVHIVAHNCVRIGRYVSITANCAIVDVTHPIDGPSDRPGSLIADDDRSVDIGDGTFLGIGAVILPGVVLGRRCVVGANSVVTQSFPAGSVIAGAPARLLRSLHADAGIAAPSDGSIVRE